MCLCTTHYTQQTVPHEETKQKQKKNYFFLFIERYCTLHTAHCTRTPELNYKLKLNFGTNTQNSKPFFLSFKQNQTKQTPK